MVRHILYSADLVKGIRDRRLLEGPRIYECESR